MGAASPRTFNLIQPGSKGRTQEVSALLSELWALLAGPGWSGPPALKQAISRTARLLAVLPGDSTSKARRRAEVLAQALERIGKGVWPAVSRSRAFLGECVRGLAASYGVAPFWTEEEKDRLAAPDAPPQPAEVPEGPEPVEAARAGEEFCAAATAAAAAARPPEVAVLEVEILPSGGSPATGQDEEVARIAELLVEPRIPEPAGPRERGDEPPPPEDAEAVPAHEDLLLVLSDEPEW